MKTLHFVLTECTFLRYYIPLIEECKKRQIKCVMYEGRSNKYNCPKISANKQQIEKLKEEFDFESRELESLKSLNGEKIITVEGCGIDNCYKDNDVYSVTYMTDFIGSYKNYKNKIKKIFLPSQTFLKLTEISEDKSAIVGSPKYDFKSTREIEREKLGIDLSKKIALLVYPRSRDIRNIDLSTICKTLNEKGFIVLAKTRGKDPIREDHKKYFYRSFSDESWYPHTTMELIIASDLVVNTGSTTIKECIMFDTPIINFNIKPFSNLPLHFLENYSFNRVMPKKDFKTSDLIDAIDWIENNNFKEEFERARKDHLFQKDIKSSSKIITSILES